MATQIHNSVPQSAVATAQALRPALDNVISFKGGAVGANALKAAQTHRSEQVDAFIQAVGGGQGKALLQSVSRVASPALARDCQALFGAGSRVLGMVKELQAQKDNPAHLTQKENMQKANQIGLIVRGIEELKTAVKLADNAPQVGENFAAHQKNLAVAAQRLTTIAQHMPDSPEGQQMQKLATSMAQVCQQKSQHIAANQQRLDSLVHYDAAIDAVTKKMDDLDAKMHALSAAQSAKAADASSVQQLVQQQSHTGNTLLALQDQYTALEKEREDLMQAQDKQEQSIAQLHPRLQTLADQKLAAALPAKPTLAASQAVAGKTVAESAAAQGHDLIAQTYSSALDFLNARIAHHYGFKEETTARKLMLYRDTLRTNLNKHLENSAQVESEKSVNNVVPGANQRLGLTDRIRVKFQAKAAFRAGKILAGNFPAKLTQLDAKTTMAAYLQAAFRNAGISGSDLPSKASLRGQLQAGINHPQNFPDFGKIVSNKVPLAPEAVPNQAAPAPEDQSPKLSSMQLSLTDTAKQFDSTASSVYTRLMLKASTPDAFLKKASIPELFMARQRATQLFMDPSMPNQDVHKKHQTLIDNQIQVRLNRSDATLQALHADADKTVLGNARLVGERELMSGLERVSHLHNVAPAAYYKIKDLDADLATYLQNNPGPAYGIVNENGHWVSVVASKTTDGRVSSYIIDSQSLQADDNKALPNGCGPLQILMHSELSKRLKMDPQADPIETMVAIESELQATDKNVLYSAVLQQRMESIDQVVQLTQLPSISASNYAAQIDDMAQAFQF
jgi:hypothetical protein